MSLLHVFVFSPENLIWPKVYIPHLCVCVCVAGLVVSRLCRRGGIAGTPGNRGKLKFIHLTVHTHTHTNMSNSSHWCMDYIIPSYEHTHRCCPSGSEEAEFGVVLHDCFTSTHWISKKTLGQELYLLRSAHTHTFIMEIIPLEHEMYWSNI